MPTRRPPGSREQFAWDAAGNLLDDIQRKSQGQVQDNRLRMWQDLRFDYDPWGNLATKRKGSQQTQHFVFDAEDRLVAVKTTSGRGTVETRFQYDALGRRIAKTEVQQGVQDATPFEETRRFVWQGLRMVQELRAGGVSSYIYSPDAGYTPLARIDAVIGEALAASAIDPAIALSNDYHTRGPALDTRGIGGAHYHEAQIRKQRYGLGRNEFHANPKIEMDIAQGGIRKAGIPASRARALRKQANKFHRTLTKGSGC